MKNFFTSFLCTLFFISVVNAQTLQLEKNFYSPGEKILVYFSAPTGLAEDAWIGILPANIPHGSEAENDGHDLTYQHLKGRTTGTLTFKAPTEFGEYDFRMHDTDNSGNEIASVNFSVGAMQSYANANVRIDKTLFEPGESITVHFSAPDDIKDNAWIGIIPSNIPHGREEVNDQNDISYQYLKNRSTGSLTFLAPKKAGSYDFRMNDSDDNGREIASVSFTVAIENGTMENEAFLSLDNEVYGAGTSIVLHFTAPANFPDNAWIGIIPASVPHGKEAVNDENDISYQYLQKRTTGTLTFQAPQQPGQYDFRMHDTDNNGREVYTITFFVE